MRSNEHRGTLHPFLGAVAIAICTFAPSPLYSGEKHCPAFEDARAIAALSQAWQVLRCKGDSMEPAIRNGDYAIVDTSAFTTVQPGMMVAFLDEDGALVLHRVELATESEFRTRGLRNRTLDPLPLSEKNFQGVVIAVLRSSGDNHFVAEQVLPVALCRERAE